MKMINYFTLVFFFFFFFSEKVCAQFNTITPDRRVINVNSVGLGYVSKMNTGHKKLVNTPICKDSTIRSMRREFLFSLPLKQLSINSPFGYRNDPFTGKRKFHSGIDYAASADNVYSLMPGRITELGYDKKGLGNYVRIEHGDFQVTYGHLHTYIGIKGSYVNAGDIVGITGSTGRSTGEHLHVSIRFKGKIIDPYPVLQYIERYIVEIRGTLSIDSR